jgi:hypothetical protein
MVTMSQGVSTQGGVQGEGFTMASCIRLCDALLKGGTLAGVKHDLERIVGVLQ